MQRTQFNEAAGAAVPRNARGRSDGRSLGTLMASVGAAGLLFCSAPAPAQQLEQAMRHPWTLYIFVSSGMPHQGLVSLAREAARAHASMVFRGFPGNFFDLQAEQRLVAQLNEECCGVSASPARSNSASGRAATAAAQEVPSWSIDPALYRRFEVSVVPTFVLAETGGAGDQAFTKVAGDMALASALKFVAQGSASPSRRAAASSIYQTAYGGRQ